MGQDDDGAGAPIFVPVEAKTHPPKDVEMADSTNHTAFPMLTFQILFSGLTFLLLLRSYKILRIIYASHITTS